MAVKQISEKLQQIVKKLDEIIAMSRSPELSFSKEVMFKLISAIAIAILVEYLLIGDKSNSIVPLNWYIAGVYFFSLILYDYYCVRTHPRNNTLKLIESIGAIIYGTYVLALIGNPWNLSQNPNLNTLYFVALFFLAVGQLFYLVNYGYRTPIYATINLFRNHRDLIINSLYKFSIEERNLAIAEIELIERKLHRAVLADIHATAMLGLILHYISILLFLPIDSVGTLWFDRTALCLLLLGIFLSLVTIAAIIKNIKHDRDGDRFAQYLLILHPLTHYI